MTIFRALPLAMVCIYAFAQTPPQEVVSNDAPATFQSRVNLVMVPVVVRDKNGRAVGDLKKEDFQLFDKNKPQTIARFSVEKSTNLPGTSSTRSDSPPDAGPAPAAIPNRFVAYVFDDVHSDFGDLVRARDAADRHIKETLGPADRAAIFTTSGQNLLDFTDDRDKLHEILFKIHPQARQDGKNGCPPMTYYVADLIANRNDMMALTVATQDAMVCASLPKSAQSTAASLAQAAASNTVAMGDLEAKSALGLLTDVVRRLAAAPGQRSLILTSAGFLITLDHRPDEIELMDRAIHAGVVINAINARGLYVDIPGGDASERTLSLATAPQKAQLQRAGAAAEEDTLAELADGTGGTFFHNNNDLHEGYTRAAARPEYIYILGFSPQNLKLDGEFHALKVKLATRGFTLQVRRGYYAPKHATDRAEQANEEIRESLFSRDELRDIPFDLETQFFKPAADSAKLTVVARIDVRPLHFQKANGVNNNTVIVVWGIFDHNGNWITGIKKTLSLKLKDETLATRLASGIALRSSFDLTPGRYLVRLVARDSEGQMMAARNGMVEIP